MNYQRNKILSSFTIGEVEDGVTKETVADALIMADNALRNFYCICRKCDSYLPQRMCWSYHNPETTPHRDILCQWCAS